jgi:hypothetical protein
VFTRVYIKIKVLKWILLKNTPKSAFNKCSKYVSNRFKYSKQAKKDTKAKEAKRLEN